MKKYLLLFICLLLVTGCSLKKEKKKVEITPSEPVDLVPEEPAYVDNNPVIVGIYQNGKLVHDVTIPFNINADLASFDVYFTNDQDVGSSNTKRNFNKYAAKYENAKQYKIGFIVSFTAGDKTVSEYIMGPKQMYKLSPYIFNYLYDDVNQADGTWYDHVEEKDVSDNTIYSSIKLFGTDHVKEITSPITLTVFTYDTEDDFDDEGLYRGNSKYTITINKR